MPVLITAISVLGLAVGSFLNVVTHRVPAAKSVIRPAVAARIADFYVRLISPA